MSHNATTVEYKLLQAKAGDTSVLGTLDQNTQIDAIYTQMRDSFGYSPKFTGYVSNLMTMVPPSAPAKPIPNRSKILSAELVFTSVEVNTSSFATAINLVKDDDKWSQDGSGGLTWQTGFQFYDHSFRCRAAGAVQLVGTQVVATGGSVDIGRHSGYVDSPEQLCQAAVCTVSGTVNNFQLALRRVGNFSAAPWSTQWCSPTLYRSMAQDGSDDSPDIGFGAIARGSLKIISPIPTTMSTQTFPCTTGIGGFTGFVTSGTRYTCVFSKSWAESLSDGAHAISWGFQGFTTGPFSYTNGTPGTYGTRLGFNQVNYPLQVEAPNVFTSVGLSTPGVKNLPFGSILLVNTPDFPALNEEVSIPGLAILIQEWVDQPNYNPLKPLAVTCSFAWNNTSGFRDPKGFNNDPTLAPYWRITYGQKRIHIV